MRRIAPRLVTTPPRRTTARTSGWPVHAIICGTEFTEDGEALVDRFDQLAVQLIMAYAHGRGIVDPAKRPYVVLRDVVPVTAVACLNKIQDRYAVRMRLVLDSVRSTGGLGASTLIDTLYTFRAVYDLTLINMPGFFTDLMRGARPPRPRYMRKKPSWENFMSEYWLEELHFLTVKGDDKIEPEYVYPKLAEDASNLRRLSFENCSGVFGQLRSGMFPLVIARLEQFSAISCDPIPRAALMQIVDCGDTLQSLTLNDVGLTDEHLRVFFESIWDKGLSQIRLLDITLNPISAAALETFVIAAAERGAANQLVVRALWTDANGRLRPEFADESVVLQEYIGAMERQPGRAVFIENPVSAGEQLDEAEYRTMISPDLRADEVASPSIYPRNPAIPDSSDESSGDEEEVPYDLGLADDIEDYS